MLKPLFPVMRAPWNRSLGQVPAPAPAPAAKPKPNTVVVLGAGAGVGALLGWFFSMFVLPKLGKTTANKADLSTAGALGGAVGGLIGVGTALLLKE